MIFRCAFIVHDVSQFMTLKSRNIGIADTPQAPTSVLRTHFILNPMMLVITRLGRQQSKVIEASDSPFFIRGIG
jgi:hypothetical protein